MKHTIKYLLIVLSIFLFGSVNKNYSFVEYAENIKNFQTNITVNKDGTIGVKEIILCRGDEGGGSW